jgi:hypothetical protein
MGKIWLIDEVWRLWLATAAVVLVVSVIHYAWSTSIRKDMARKYQRRFSPQSEDLDAVWPDSRS